MKKRVKKRKVLSQNEILTKERDKLLVTHNKNNEELKKLTPKYSKFKLPLPMNKLS